MRYDREGTRFIPLATRNVFLKYYTDSNENPTHLDRVRWNAGDRQGYLKAIHQMVDPIFDSIVKPVQKADYPESDQADSENE